MKGIPAQFKLGGVYLADFMPSLEVEKLDSSSALLAQHFGIAVEIVDDIKVSEALFRQGNLTLTPTKEEIESVTPESTVRYVLRAQDARFLCFNLIETLADGGDRVAMKIREKLTEVLEEMEE